MRKSLLSLALLSLTITAQAQYRLNDLAIESYDPQTQMYVNSDSVHYHYSGIRGGYIANEQYYYAYDYTPVTRYFSWNTGPHMDYNTLLHYDSALLYQRDQAPNVVHTKNIQTFNGNHISKWDKLSIYHQNNPGNFNNYGSRQNTYANGRLSNYTMLHSLNTTINYSYRYNAQNMPDSIIRQYTSGGSSSINFTKYHYDQNNRLLGQDSYSSNTTGNIHGSKQRIFYTQAGMVDSILWMYRQQTGGLDTASWTVFTYNTNSQLTEQRHYLKSLHGNSGWTHIYTIKMSYNSSGQRAADTTYYDYAVHHLNTGLLKRALRTYGYDAYGIVNSYEVQYWDSNGSTWGGGVDSIYGAAMRINADYTGKLSIGKTIAAGKQDIQLYPIPAHNLITIKATMPDDKSFEVLVYDMLGAVIKRWQEQGVVNYTRTIPTDDIPAGTYILSLSGSDVHMTKRMVIVK